MLIRYTYNGKESVFECEKPQVLIGRPRDGMMIDLDLTPDRAVSRPHARLTVEDKTLCIEDLGSIRGTKVNNADIKGKGKRKLRVGDVIDIGDTTLKVTIAEF